MMGSLVPLIFGGFNGPQIIHFIRSISSFKLWFWGSPTLRKPSILWVSIIYVYNILYIILYIYIILYSIIYIYILKSSMIITFYGSSRGRPGPRSAPAVTEGLLRDPGKGWCHAWFVWNDKTNKQIPLSKKHVKFEKCYFDLFWAFPVFCTTPYAATELVYRLCLPWTYCWRIHDDDDDDDDDEEKEEEEERSWSQKSYIVYNQVFVMELCQRFA